ncbi:MAG: Ig-like domain-containing protein, partial [Propionibacteriaceae bacterium]|nr:Ig-like domain-containing protein [Propionibacteriaceae bacterium]
QTDAAGHDSPARTVGVTVDLTAPAAPGVSSPAAGALINDATPTVTGTGEPGATVTIQDGTGNTACTTTVVAGGTWSCPVGTDLPEGPVTLVVTQTDPAGNQSSATTRAVTVDTTAPAPPVITTADAQSVAGTADPGTTVTVTWPDQTTSEVPADGTGHWSVATPPDMIPGTVSVVATDAAGNSSPAATADLALETPGTPVVETANATLIAGTVPTPVADGTTVTVTYPTTQGTATVDAAVDPVTGQWSVPTPADAVSGPVSVVATSPGGKESAAGTGTLDVDAPAAPVVTSPAEGAAINDPTPTVAGTGEPGATVTVRDGDGTPLCTVTVAAGGTWSCDVTTRLGEGPVTLVVTQTDPAGNASGESTVDVTVDLTAPALPVVTAPAAGATLTEAAPTVAGTGEPGATVTVQDGDGNTLCTVTVPAGGTWSCTAGTDVPEGPLSLVVTQTDPAGNVSGEVTVAVTVDTTQPGAPQVTTANATVIAGTVPTPVAEGTTVTVTYPTADGTATVDADVDPVTGQWSVPTPPDAVSGPVSVVATPPGGKESAAGTGTLDVDAPVAPVVTAPAEGAAINDPTPTVIGTGEPGATVTIRDGDGNPLCTVTVPAGGTWSCDVTTDLGEGPVALVVTQTDAAGNPSPATTRNVTVDTTAPAAPTITTADATTVAGTADPGTTVLVTWPDGTSTPVTTDDTGAWSVPTPGGMTSGTLTVVAEDAAGNTSAAVTTRLNLDAPDAPVVTTANATTIAGTVPTPVADGTTVTVTYPTTQGTATVTADVDPVTGQWSLATPPDAISGPLTVVAMSPARVPSSPGTATLDVDAPAAPVVTAPKAGTTVGSATPTVTGTGEPGATVTVQDGAGHPVCTATAGVTGQWSCTPATALGEGPVTLVVTQTDPAGNPSA